RGWRGEGGECPARRERTPAFRNGRVRPWRARPVSRTLAGRGPAAVDQPRRKPATSDTPRRRGRPPIPPEQQRRRLLEAARAELRRSDFGSVRVSDVVRTAGMSSRSFYDHFASKEDLLIAH